MRSLFGEPLDGTDRPPVASFGHAVREGVVRLEVEIPRAKAILPYGSNVQNG